MLDRESGGENFELFCVFLLFSSASLSIPLVSLSITLVSLEFNNFYYITKKSHLLTEYTGGGSFGIWLLPTRTDKKKSVGPFTLVTKVTNVPLLVILFSNAVPDGIISICGVSPTDGTFPSLTIIDNILDRT